MNGVMDSLVQFCIDQRCAFDAAAWLAKFDEVGEPVALAAKYLSMTSWYGHEVEMEHISMATQRFAENRDGLRVESQAMDFDLHTFSIRVRLGLAHARCTTRTPKRAAPSRLHEDS